MQRRYAFFLGGQDLEMVTIAGLLQRLQAAGDPRIAQIVDRGLVWGAKASDYGDLIAGAVQQGATAVLVELIADIPLPSTCIKVAHHGNRSAEPASLRQVFDLLELPAREWSRRFELVAANDTGHIRALFAAGASPAEVAEIRRADRQAQGIKQSEEAQGLAALSGAETALGGSLLVLDLPHGRTATVADPLALQGDARDVLIFSPNTTNFFGVGARIARLDAAFPGGWRGGELPRRGFWGHPTRLSRQTVLSALI